MLGRYSYVGKEQAIYGLIKMKERGDYRAYL